MLYDRARPGYPAEAVEFALAAAARPAGPAGARPRRRHRQADPAAVRGRRDRRSRWSPRPACSRCSSTPSPGPRCWPAAPRRCRCRTPRSTWSRSGRRSTGSTWTGRCPRWPGCCGPADGSRCSTTPGTASVAWVRALAGLIGDHRATTPSAHRERDPRVLGPFEPEALRRVPAPAGAGRGRAGRAGRHPQLRRSGCRPDERAALLGRVARRWPGPTRSWSAGSTSTCRT